MVGCVEEIQRRSAGVARSVAHVQEASRVNGVSGGTRRGFFGSEVSVPCGAGIRIHERTCICIWVVYFLFSRSSFRFLPASRVSDTVGFVCLFLPMGLKAQYWAKDPDAVVMNGLERVWHELHYNPYTLVLLGLMWSFFACLLCSYCIRIQTQSRKMKEYRDRNQHQLLSQRLASFYHYD